MTFELTLDTDARVAVIRLRGELDIDTVPTLRQAFADLFDSGGARVEVDLSELDFLDSTGISALVAGYTAAQERGGWLCVVGAHGMPLRALELTGIATMLCTPRPTNVDLREEAVRDAVAEAVRDTSPSGSDPAAARPEA